MTEYPETYRFPWWRNRSYLLLSAIMFMSLMSGGLVKPLFSIRAQGLGATLVEIGLIGTVSQIVGMAVQYLWGQQSDRLMRRKPLILIGMIGNAFTTFLVGVVSGHRPLYWIQALNVLAYAAYTVGSLAMIGDILEGWPSRGRLMGLYRGAGSFAFGLASLFGGRLADLYGMATPFFFASAFGFVAFLFACGLQESPVQKPKMTTEKPSFVETQISWDKLRRILPFLIIVFIWSVSMGSAFAFWPVYMVERGFTKTVVTQLWGIAALGETVAMVFAGYLCDRLGSRRVVVEGLAGMGLIFMAYTFWPRFPWLIPIQVIRALVFSCYSAASMIYATEMGLRQQRGRMAGLHATAASVGTISGSALGGLLAQLLGVGIMIRGIGALMVLGGLLAGWRMAEPAETAVVSKKPARRT